MMCNIDYHRDQEFSFRRKYILPVKSPFDINWNWIPIGRGQTLLNIDIKNKVEAKKVLFEKCDILAVQGDMSLEILSETQDKLIASDKSFNKSFKISTADCMKDFSDCMLALNLVWKSETGTQGHIQYSQIRPKVDQKAHLELAILRKSKDERFSLKHKELQPITLQVTNNSERNVDLTLELDFDEKSSIQWNGSSRTLIGILSPAEKKEIELTCVPLLVGQFALPGFKLRDSLLNHDYNYSNFATFVVE